MKQKIKVEIVASKVNDEVIIEVASSEANVMFVLTPEAAEDLAMLMLDAVDDLLAERDKRRAEAEKARIEKDLTIN